LSRPLGARRPRGERQRPRAQVERLLAAQDDLHRRLRESEEELDAARRLNRTLIREHSANASELGHRPA
jgi:stress response protein YsnF